MLILLAMLVADAPLPGINVVPEADHFRLTVEQFSWSQGEAVNKAMDRKMDETCKDQRVEMIEFDFNSADPDNHLTDGPPIERQVWGYWATFKCVDPSTVS